MKDTRMIRIDASLADRLNTIAREMDISRVEASKVISIQALE